MGLILDGTTGISASGNIAGGNIIITGSISGGTYSPTAISVTGNVQGNYIIGNGSLLTGLPAGYANSDVSLYLASGTVSTDIITTANIAGGNLSVSTGTVTVGNIVTTVSAVGNIGSTALPFNTVFAKATSALYADLAEKYSADAEYTPGTVVSFGGSAEVTVSTVNGDRRVAGVVSTNPSYIMNSGLTGTVATVALTGRVPTLVTGSVRKGDLMVSNGDGSARAEDAPATGSVIGKSLVDFDGEIGTIEIVVGRL